LNEFEDLKQRLLEFAGDRNWEQFHSPKNLSMALMVEAAELLEHFQWLTQEQSYNLSPETLIEVEHELADILIYLTRLAGKLDVDLFAAAVRKMDVNEKKYLTGCVAVPRNTRNMKSPDDPDAAGMSL
jgi:NTP pyrophosphatase (non-canonical NTP hydrolase)